MADTCNIDVMHQPPPPPTSEMEAQLEELSLMQQAVNSDAHDEKQSWVEAHRAYRAGVAALAAITQLTHDFIDACIKDPQAWVKMGQNGTVQQIHKGLTDGKV